MCGITGIISNQPINTMIAIKMNDTLTHRGPDGYGYLCSHKTLNTNITDKLIKLNSATESNFILAHRRLSIHDLSEAGHQPMSYLNRYWLTFNGEIYNFIELKNELEKKGYSFHSQTDTEVILAAFDCWGIECLSMFNGEWAFVLIDIHSQHIFISRDRFGIKPLYYFSLPGIFIFASEIKAILEHPDVKKSPNLDYLKKYIKHGPNEYGTETAFHNISHFDFASYFYGPIKDLLQPEKVVLKNFWSLHPNLSNEVLNEEKLKDYSDNYYALLQDAVRVRLRADVKIGANLSGGLDSSSIVLLIQKIYKQSQYQNPLKTFSSVYKTSGTLDCDESVLINEMTHYLNIDSHQIEPVVNDIPHEHRKMIYHLDSPPESTLMSSWYTAKLIQSTNIRVTLTGEGADEQLAGYLRYMTYHFSNLRLGNALAHYPLFHRFLGAKTYLHLGLVANLSKRILGKKLSQYLYNKMGRTEKIFTPLNQKLKEDILTHLVNLHHIDERVFMAFSIEHRAPFMDHRLVEFLAAVPASYKLAKGNTKYLARIAFHPELPTNINWSKTKLGWPIPEKFWMEGELKTWVQSIISHSAFLKHNHFFSLKNPEQTTITNKIRLLNMAVWHSVFFD